MIFHTDLDNTLIYSYKHNIGPEKVNVEIYQNREISFMTEYAFELLKKVNEKVLLVPTTTRTIEQYNRISLGIGIPKYALVCNGGILLVDGKEDTCWYEESLHMVRDTADEMRLAWDFLEKDSRRIFELRFIRELFLFTKCENPDKVVLELRERLHSVHLEVLHNGSKVYVLPKCLEKGRGVRRFLEYMGGGTVIGAGDSEFDVSMLNQADIAIAPKELKGIIQLSDKTVFMPGDRLFSDELLDYIYGLIP